MPIGWGVRGWQPAPTAPTTAYADTEYAPYGESYGVTGTLDLNFTGQNQDTVPSANSGLYDFLFREYNPQHGRWISPDPAGKGAVILGVPQTWNRYAYVANGPLNSVDPLGLFRSWDQYDKGGFDNSCSINGMAANCGMASALLAEGGGGAAAVDCGSNCDPFISGALRIGGGGQIVTPNGDLFYLSGDRPASLSDFGLVASANNGNCGITVKCRGIQTDNLGKIGVQHCDAQVTDSSGALWSLSGGPQPNYMSITALNAWATSPPTEPFTGTTVYQGNSCSAAGCMIQSTQAWNKDIVKPEYGPVSGPNSNTWLKGTAAGCGVSLRINTWGSIW